MLMLKALIQLARPMQWTKNAFCFLPLFFSGKIADVHSLAITMAVFLAFSFTSSSIYCLNDIRDAEADRCHPKKCRRPVASGAVSVPAACAFMALLLCCAAAIVWLLPLDAHRLGVALILGLYFAMNIAYCLKLKQIPLIDVSIISVGFVLRVVVDGVACGIFISHWIVIMTFLLALFLALCKRRDDVMIYQETGLAMRKNINRYNSDFMNLAITIVATVTLVAYIMYTVSPEVLERFDTQWLYITSLFVLLGILRYLQITLVQKGRSGSPTKVILRDRFIQACILAWMLTFAIIIYL